MEMSAPQVNRIVSNALIHYGPHINQMLPQISWFILLMCYNNRLTILS